MLSIKKIAVLGLCLWMFACGNNIKTSNDYRTEVQFSELTLYSFLPFDSSAVKNIDQDRIKKSLTDELALKGLTAVEESEANVLIAYHVFTETLQKQRVTTTGGSYYYGRRHYGPSINMGTTYIDNIDYKVGNLIVDFIEPKSRKVLYHAEASSKVADAKTPEDRRRLIDQAVKEMLADYPPKAGE